MKLAFFDCHNGISGDMVLGALVDLGVDLAGLQRKLRRLPLKGFTLKAERVTRCGIAVTQVHVRLARGPQKSRHFPEIKDLIEKSPLPSRVKARAVEAFLRLARAEAKAHRTTIRRVHFHEVGAVDAIVDIVGAMLGIEELGIERIAASPVATGTGSVETAHGELPVPAPATVELLKGVPIRGSDIPFELATPTGCAILTTLTQSFGEIPPMRLEAVGYGAGSRTFPRRTNALRVLVGEAEERTLLKECEEEALILVSTEIDDMNPEIYSGLMERLFAGGCLDAVLVPVQMKKGRPGVRVDVLGHSSQEARLVELLMRETSTFGVKVIPLQRHCLRRRKESVKTPLGKVDVKIGYWGDELLKVKPEYESCRELAEQTGRPLLEIYRLAEQAIMGKYNSSKIRNR